MMIKQKTNHLWSLVISPFFQEENGKKLNLASSHSFFCNKGWNIDAVMTAVFIRTGQHFTAPKSFSLLLTGSGKSLEQMLPLAPNRKPQRNLIGPWWMWQIELQSPSKFLFIYLKWLHATSGTASTENLRCWISHIAPLTGPSPPIFSQWNIPHSTLNKT